MEEAIVIIGAGEAGCRAAASLRDRGFQGSVVLVGDESHAPYERPPLSKAFITSDPLPASPPLICDHGKLSELSIQFRSGVRAEAIDRSARIVCLSEGPDLRYSRLLLATGAAPRRLDLAGSTGNVLYLRTVLDAMDLRRRLRPSTEIVIIGAGFIGLEVAASAVARNCKVTIVEAAPRILMRGVPAVVAERIAARHRAAGVSIHLSAAIEEIRRDDDHYLVQMKDGAALACDLVLAGIGAVPETGLAAASGLRVVNGICVDVHLRTDDPSVFAAGDCCSFPHPLYAGQRVRLEAWRSAQNQGAVAAENILGVETPYAAVPWFWSDQYDETLQVAGLFDPRCDTIERKLGDTASIYFHLGPEGRLLATSGFGPNGLIARDMRLVEMLIERGARCTPADLANPAVNLKALLSK